MVTLTRMRSCLRGHLVLDLNVPLLAVAEELWEHDVPDLVALEHSQRAHLIHVWRACNMKSLQN